jgi:hypothetical protein
MMNRKIDVLLATTALLALAASACSRPEPTPTPAPTPAEPAIWVVSPDGSDENDCLSTASACLTVNGAIYRAAAGDTIRILVGTYVNGPHSWAAPGSPAIPILIDKPLTLIGTGTGTTILDGGGVTTVVVIQGEAGEVSMRDLAVTNGGYGGGSLNGCGLRVNSTTAHVVLTNLYVHHNNCSDEGFGGGGIFNRGNLELYEVRVEDNTLTTPAPHTGQGMGGGIFNRGNLRMQGGTILRNQDLEWRGGGLANGNDDRVHAFLYNVWIDGNTAGDLGGGVYNNGGALTILHSTVSHNAPEGIFNRSGQLVIENTTVSGNAGAGIELRASLDLNYSTVSDNEYGVLWYPGDGSDVLDISDSIIAGNRQYAINSQGYALLYPTPYVALRRNVFGSLDPRVGFGGCAAGIWCLFPDPGLAPLGDGSGGPPIHALLPVSPAVDSGARNCPPDDQLGLARPAGPACDMGAHELELTTSALEGTPVTLETVAPTQAAGPVFTFTQQANCRKGPNTAYESLGFGQVGEQVPIEGLSDPAGWYYVQLQNGARCFSAGSTGDVSGSLDGLPVIPAPPLPVLATVTPTSTPEPPGAPELNVSTKICDSSEYVVRLSWKDVQGETGYRVYRDGALVATLGANATLYDDTSPDYNAHAYRVEAYNDAGTSSSATKNSEGCLY